MVAQHPVGPGLFGERRFVIVDEPADRSRVPSLHRHELKVERQMYTPEVLAVVHEQALKWQVDLPYQHLIPILVGHRPHLAHDFVHLGTVPGVDSVLPI